MESCSPALAPVHQGEPSRRKCQRVVPIHSPPFVDQVCHGRKSCAKERSCKYERSNPGLSPSPGSRGVDLLLSATTRPRPCRSLPPSVELPATFLPPSLDPQINCVDHLPSALLAFETPPFRKNPSVTLHPKFPTACRETKIQQLLPAPP